MIVTFPHHINFVNRYGSTKDLRAVTIVDTSVFKRDKGVFTLRFQLLWFIIKNDTLNFYTVHVSYLIKSEFCKK